MLQDIIKALKNTMSTFGKNFWTYGAQNTYNVHTALSWKSVVQKVNGDLIKTNPKPIYSAFNLKFIHKTQKDRVMKF